MPCNRSPLGWTKTKLWFHEKKNCILPRLESMVTKHEIKLIESSQYNKHVLKSYSILRIERIQDLFLCFALVGPAYWMVLVHSAHAHCAQVKVFLWIYLKGIQYNNHLWFIGISETHSYWLDNISPSSPLLLPLYYFKAPLQHLLDLVYLSILHNFEYCKKETAKWTQPHPIIKPKTNTTHIPNFKAHSFPKDSPSLLRFIPHIGKNTP